MVTLIKADMFDDVTTIPSAVMSFPAVFLLQDSEAAVMQIRDQRRVLQREGRDKVSSERGSGEA